MWMVTYGRYANIANYEIAPAVAPFGTYSRVWDENGNEWNGRGFFSRYWQFYRVAQSNEPSSYTFVYSTDPDNPWSGPVEASFIVGAIVAYRGADNSGVVGGFPTQGGDPILFPAAIPGYEGYTGEAAPGMQLVGYYDAEGHDPNPMITNWEFCIVEGQRTVLLVSSDWLGPGYAGEYLDIPDPPQDLPVTLPPGFQIRVGGSTGYGSLITIADGLPEASSWGTERLWDGPQDPPHVIATGTWQGRSVDFINGFNFDITVVGSGGESVQTVNGHNFRIESQCQQLPLYGPPITTRYFIATWRRGSARGISQHRGGEGVLHRREF